MDDDSLRVDSSITEPDLFCPKCEYSLRGLTSNICPECGYRFDRTDLLKFLTDVRSSCAWDALPNAVTYLQTICLIAFGPNQFARQLAWVPKLPRARLFSFICYLLAACFVGISMFISASDPPVAIFVATVVSGTLAAWICEVIVAGLLSTFARPRGNPAVRRYDFWRAATHYGSVFLLFSSLWTVFCACLADNLEKVNSTILTIGFGVSVLWWATCLAIIVGTRTGQPWKSLAAAVSCLVAACAAIVGGFYGAFFITIVLWGAFGTRY